MWLTRKPCVSAPAVTVTDWRGESVVATEGSVDSNGVRVVYHTAGEGPLVIFVHGVSSPWHDYRHQIPMLAEKYRVVAMSTRGTDMSDKPEGYENYFAEHISNDISAIIEHLGEDKATIVGQDSGGLYAWHFAMTRPEQTERLISIGTVHPGGLTRELIDNPEQQQANQFQRNMQVFPEAGNDFGQGVRAAPRDPDEPANLAQLRREAAACLDTDSVVGFYKTNWPTSPTTMETESVGFKIGEFPPVKGADAVHLRQGRSVLPQPVGERDVGVGRRAADDPGAPGGRPRAAQGGAGVRDAAHHGMARDRSLGETSAAVSRT